MTEIKHNEFGRLSWDDDHKRYKATMKVGNDGIELTFEASNKEQLDLLLSSASSLWRQRDEWFRQWLVCCFDYYTRELKDEWYEGHGILDFEGFKSRLGNPVSIEFHVTEGSARYMMTGMNDDLVGDHCLEAHGTDLKPDEVYFT